MEEFGAAEVQGSGFHALSRPQLIGTIAGLMLTLLLAALDKTIVGTAMPKIIAQLNGFERYAWVTTAYLLTSTIAVPIVGKLSDLFGRKWILLGGAVIFVAASALCGAAGNLPLPIDGMNQLILFRGLQGIGGRRDHRHRLHRRSATSSRRPSAASIQGALLGVFGLASVFGPALGGWITDSFTWRWVFYVNLPVGIVAVAVLFFSSPTSARGGRRVIDWRGVGDADRLPRPAAARADLGRPSTAGPRRASWACWSSRP